MTMIAPLEKFVQTEDASLVVKLTKSVYQERFAQIRNVNMVAEQTTTAHSRKHVYWTVAKTFAIVQPLVAQTLFVIWLHIKLLALVPLISLVILKFHVPDLSKCVFHLPIVQPITTVWMEDAEKNVALTLTVHLARNVLLVIVSPYVVWIPIVNTTKSVMLTVVKWVAETTTNVPIILLA